MNLGRSIKKVRQGLDINQGEFAGKVGVTQSYLSQLENNQKKPSFEVLTKISELSGFPLPIMLWYSISEDDVSDDKKAAFRLLRPSVDGLIQNIFFSK